jgi:hypothetical protein
MRRLLVVLATSLGILGIAGGGQLAGAAPTDKAVSACDHHGGTYATTDLGYTCTSSSGFKDSQVREAAKICFNDEGGISFSSSSTNGGPITSYYCQQIGA